jgi:hypothetical protein
MSYSRQPIAESRLRHIQAQGRAPPPQVAEPRAKTTLFARGALGRAGARIQRFN